MFYRVGTRQIKAYLDSKEIKALEEQAGSLRDRLLIRLLFYLACRVSEALALATNDIDIITGTVTIQHLKERLRLKCPECNSRLSRSSSYCPGCGNKVTEALNTIQEHRRKRILPIDPATLVILKEYIDRGGPVNRNGKLFIFGINRHRAWQIVTECARRAGLPKIINTETGKIHQVSPHRLRDAFAVNAVKHDDSGDGLRMLQEHLGHTSFNTTARYRKVAGEEHREWYDRLWQDGDGPNVSQT